jgi:hypothetical protein
MSVLFLNSCSLGAASRSQKGITTDFTDGTDKDISIREIREIRGQDS